MLRTLFDFLVQVLSGIFGADFALGLGIVRDSKVSEESKDGNSTISAQVKDAHAAQEPDNDARYCAMIAKINAQMHQTAAGLGDVVTERAKKESDSLFRP